MDSKYGPNSKIMKSTKSTFLQSTAEFVNNFGKFYPYSKYLLQCMSRWLRILIKSISCSITSLIIIGTGIIVGEPQPIHFTIILASFLQGFWRNYQCFGAGAKKLCYFRLRLRLRLQVNCRTHKSIFHNNRPKKQFRFPSAIIFLYN